MTVESTTSRVQYAGNDSATEFAVPWQFLEDGHVAAVLTADGADADLTLGVDFSLSGTGDPEGGTLTYPLSGAPLAAGEVLTIYAVLPLTQEKVWSNTDAIDVTEIEKADDKLTRICQQLSEELGRCLKYPVSADDPDTDLGAVTTARAEAQAARDAAVVAQTAAEEAESNASDSETACAAYAAHDHNTTANRDAADAHPQSAVTGLVAALAGKSDASHTHADKLGVIAANLTLYVGPTGDDATGDGTSGNPWKTLNAAFDYLEDYWIPNDKWVYILLQDGVNDMAGLQTLHHPCGDRIIIKGENYYPVTLSSIQSSSGASGAYSLVLNVSDVGNIVAGDFILCRTPSGGTNPERMAGCMEVTSVDAVNTRITVLSSNRIGVPSGAVTGTLNVVKAVLRFGSGHGIEISKGNRIYELDKLVLDGNGSGMYGLQMGNAAGGDGHAFLRIGSVCGIGVWDWGSGVLASGGSFIYARNLHIAKCSVGFTVTGCSNADGYGCTVVGCWNYGLNVTLGASINAQTAYVVGNNAGFYTLEGGITHSTAARVSGFNTTDHSPAANTTGNANAHNKVS